MTSIPPATPIDTTARGQVETISFELDLPHAPAKVWRALTEPELVSEWLLPVTGLDLAPGKDFTFKTQAFPGWDGTVSCRVLEIEPLRKLRYTWTVPFLDTVVTFTLAPTPSGTHLSIEQTGFTPEQKRESGGARYGWRTMGEKLVALLERMP